MHHQKQYGLILPGKAKPPLDTKSPASSKTRNVFGEDSSGDEESSVDWVKQSLKKQSQGSMQQKQSMKVMKKALEDDPSVYEYDELYDEMERKKDEVKEQKKGDRKPKYIEGLLKTAKQRDLENELRKERLAQKERENEGNMFEDKEAFVTSAYKKKMEELRQMQETQAYNDSIDDVTEITKQNDMSGFYRYLYREKMKDESKPEILSADDNNPDPDDGDDKEKSKKQTKLSEKDGSSSQPSAYDNNRDRNGTDRSRKRRNSDEKVGSSSQSSTHNNNRDRNDTEKYRKQRNSDEKIGSSSQSSRYHNNRDRNDTDRSRRRRSSTEKVGSSSQSSRYYNNRDRNDTEKYRKRTEKVGSSSQHSSSVDSKIKIVQKENWYDFDVEIERNVKKSFYAKRTVGEVFDNALQRYLTRKSINSQ